MVPASEIRDRRFNPTQFPILCLGLYILKNVISTAGEKEYKFFNLKRKPFWYASNQQILTPVLSSVEKVLPSNVV